MTKPPLQSKLVQPLRSGQITIPAEFRRVLGITPDSILRLTLEDGSLRLTPVRVEAADEERPDWFGELYTRFAPVREEAAAYSEAEIDAAIQAAVDAVRQSRRGE